jgi:hypothetical protein
VAEVSASGVDSVSYAFRPEGLAGFRAVERFRARSHRFGPAGSLIAVDRSRDGGRLMCFPATSVVAVESRLAAMLAGDDTDHSLASVAALVEGAAIARESLRLHFGVDPGPVAEVRRYDLASELRFHRAADGLAFLRTVGGLVPARMRATLERDVAGQVMTAAIRTAKRGLIRSRIYDKGLESGSDPPGVRVRIEDQNRPPRSKRQSPDVLASVDLTATFGRTMMPFLGTDELIVAGADGAVAQIAARVVTGEMTSVKAERLVGSIELLKYGGRAVYDRDGDSRKTNDKRSSLRLRSLREAGVVLSDELPADAVVPVSALLRQAIERFSV